MPQDSFSSSPIKQEIVVKTEDCLENVTITIEAEHIKTEPVSKIETVFVKIERESTDEETNPVSIETETSQVQVKQEVYVKEEPSWTGTEWDETEESPQAALYAGHDVKPDLVIGAESLQPGDAAFTKVPRRKISKRGEKQKSDDVKAPAPVKIGKLISYTAYRPRNNRKLPANIDYSPDLFICDTCLLQFTTKTRLIKHISTHKYKNTKPYYCDICDKTFAYYTYKSAHSKLHTGLKPYTCEICQKSFALANDLRSHKRNHTGEKRHVCEVCKKAFKRKSQLNIHALKHEGDKAKIFQCATCPKKFALRYKLVIHERVHADTRPYVCDVCHKGYTNKGKLGQHLRVHTKQFFCKICQKNFASKIELERHDRIHTGYRPYSCDVCGSSFSQKAHLNSHKITHTGEKPHKCDVCPKEFRSKYGLTKHKACHAGEDNSLVCKNCNKQFMVWGRWKVHEWKCPVGGKKRIRTKKSKENS